MYIYSCEYQVWIPMLLLDLEYILKKPRKSAIIKSWNDATQGRYLRVFTVIFSLNNWNISQAEMHFCECLAGEKTEDV